MEPPQEKRHVAARSSVADPRTARQDMMQVPATMARNPAPSMAAALAGGGRVAAARDYREDERLAVYDWMLRDGPAAELLEDPAALWIAAAICGDLYARRPGSPPGLRVRATAAPVRLRIVCSRLLPRRLPLLDDRAGSQYRRVTAEADYRGLVLRTQIYVLKETGLY